MSFYHGWALVIFVSVMRVLWRGQFNHSVKICAVCTHLSLLFNYFSGQVKFSLLRLGRAFAPLVRGHFVLCSAKEKYPKERRPGGLVAYRDLPCASPPQRGRSQNSRLRAQQLLAFPRCALRCSAGTCRSNLEVGACSERSALGND